ncbi:MULTISPECIES: acyl-CoA carboxylase subunit epsilon [unclassified Streptomyces]|uniref:acyl-CoA carboxylase subunit epsilon n=1 Tax=unclassified Streptomyces TaxID=2593676 RepID=UPI00331BEDED
MDEPLRLIVLRGRPDPTELATLVSVLLAVARSGGQEEEEPAGPLRASWARGPGRYRHRSQVAWKSR